MQPRTFVNLLIFKNGKITVTSFAHCAGYRHHSKDLKTDPERRLPEENFELFWIFIASKLSKKSDHELL